MQLLSGIATVSKLVFRVQLHLQKFFIPRLARVMTWELSTGTVISTSVSSQTGWHLEHDVPSPDHRLLPARWRLCEIDQFGPASRANLADAMRLECRFGRKADAIGLDDAHLIGPYGKQPQELVEKRVARRHAGLDGWPTVVRFDGYSRSGLDDAIATGEIEAVEQMLGERLPGLTDVDARLVGLWMLAALHWNRLSCPRPLDLIDICMIQPFLSRRFCSQIDRTRTNVCV